MEESSRKTETFISIDEMIEYAGSFKRFQCILCLIFCAIMLPMSYTNVIMLFAAQNPPWRCVKNSKLCTSNETFHPTNYTRCSLPRTEWKFTKSREYSIVTYFDIYCDNEWLIELSISIVFVGMIFGSLLNGWVADNYGRRFLLFISIVVVLISVFVTAFMPTIYFVIFLLFIVGFCYQGTNQMSIILSEMVGSQYRSFAGIYIWCLLPVSLCILSLKAYFIRTWRTLLIVCSLPYITVLFFYKFVPESPRWLRLHGKVDEANKTFSRIARFNKLYIPAHISILPVVNKSRNIKSNPLDLFRRKVIALKSLNLGFGALVNGMVYYGLTLSAQQFGGSLYLNVFLLSLVEIPAGVFSIIISHRYGRKYTTILALLSSGIACIIISSLPKKIAVVVFGMIGKFFISTSFNIYCVWIIELYPTILRAQAISYSSTISSCGSASSPWIVAKLTTLHPGGPYICMGLLAILSSGFFLFLSETKGLPMLETNDDEEDTEGVLETSEKQPLLQRKHITNNI